MPSKTLQVKCFHLWEAVTYNESPSNCMQMYQIFSFKKFFMEEFFQNRVRLLAVTMMEAFSKKTTTVLIFKRITNSLYNTDYRLDIFKLGHFKDSNLLL